MAGPAGDQPASWGLGFLSFRAALVGFLLDNIPNPARGFPGGGSPRTQGPVRQGQGQHGQGSPAWRPWPKEPLCFQNWWACRAGQKGAPEEWNRLRSPCRVWESGPGAGSSPVHSGAAQPGSQGGGQGPLGTALGVPSGQLLCFLVLILE